jgi:hypothetical protein
MTWSKLILNMMWVYKMTPHIRGRKSMSEERMPTVEEAVEELKRKPVVDLWPTLAVAWRAMSPYARVIYIALRSRYGHKIRNNGRIYLSTRDGAEETGFNDKTVARCLRELQHYGFIVMTEPGCLGVNGKGKAPHWRLTELGYLLDPPTRDFLKWDGEIFHEQKSPAYCKRQERCLDKLRDGQKQNPAPINGAGCTDQRSIPVHQSAVQSPDKLHQGAAHINDSTCTTDRHISRINHSSVSAPAPVFQLPAVRPDGRAVDAYLAAWATDEPALALDLLLSDFGLSGSAR